MRRLIDPIHLFNELGKSTLTEANLLEQIAKLETENAELKRRNKALTDRLETTVHQQPEIVN